MNADQEYQPDMQPVQAETLLRFTCHPGVPCFNECCRALDLALLPYDVLRLKKALGISSGEFMKNYVLVSREAGQVFPLCRLTMVDDGRASCVFVRPEGCSVYRDRPAACRAYPVGRGAALQEGTVREQFVLVREPHCQGFEQACSQTVVAYLESQELAGYNRYNDALLRLHQHPKVQDGSFQPDEQQLHRYLLALYDLDRFRQLLQRGVLSFAFPLKKEQQSALEDNDEELLLLAICWLERDFFGGR